MLLLIMAGWWTLVFAWVAPAAGWLLEQGEILFEVVVSDWTVAIGSVVVVVVAGIPAGILAINGRGPWIRAIARCWTYAAAVALVGSLVRAVPGTLLDYRLAGMALLCGLVAFGRWRWNHRARHKDARSSIKDSLSTAGTRWPLAVVVGLASVVPWAWYGALGSPQTTVLAVVTAVAIGAAAAAIGSATLGCSYDRHGTTPPRRILLGGLVFGVSLALLVTAVAGPGTALLSILVVPPMGFVATALAGGAHRPALTVTVVALAAVGPLAAVDPNQLNIALGLSDIGGFGLTASALSWLVAIVAAVTLAVLDVLSRRRATDSQGVRFFAGRRWLAAGMVAVAVVAVGVTGAVAQPGFHGNRLFVVLASQVDLTGIPRTGALAVRRAAVYQRLVRHAESSQRALLAALADRGVAATRFYLVNAIEVHTDDPVTRAWLANRAEVAAVLDSPRPRPGPVDPEPDRGTTPRIDDRPQWNIAALGADRAWAWGVRGQGVVVGSSDSGVDARHPALAAGFRGGSDSWFDPWYGTRSPRDLNGHGTHTTATAVGRLGVGVAPSASWIACTNLARNLGDPARYTACLQFMLAPFAPGADPFTGGHPARGADVLNNSWGCTLIEGCQPETLHPAARALRAAGVFSVASAGNTGPSCGTITNAPAWYDESFTVGATDRDRRISDYSSRGRAPTDHNGRSKPDIMAPGTDILSALPGGGYGTLTGTSMSGPHVAGVVALMWSANPALRGDITTTERILRETADRNLPFTYASRTDIDTCDAGRQWGAGLVNAAKAVQAARLSTEPKLDR